MVVGTYIYEPKSLSGIATLNDYHKLYGNSIKHVRSALHQVTRKDRRQALVFHYHSSHVIDSSECGFIAGTDGTLRKMVIPKNNMFGRSNVNIYGSQLGFNADYDAAFAQIENNMDDSDFPRSKTIRHRRAGYSRSTDCCLWLSVMTMLQKYDPRASHQMKRMLEEDKPKYRHMWILQSRAKNEDTFDKIMRNAFGYRLRRRSEEYLFDVETTGLFICLLKEKDGRTVHAVAVEKSNSSLMYDFEDEYPFNPMMKLDNFHGLCNGKECIGLQIVSELVPPKRKYKYFPFIV
jgi:hypothetical protein